MIKQVILITNCFPYTPGEEFLETETKFYKNYKNVKFIILPTFIGNKKRIIDSNIKIDNSLMHNNLNLKRYIFKAVISKIFYKEIKKMRILNLVKLAYLVNTVSKYLYYIDFFNNYFHTIDDMKETIVYTYWNTEITYALESLKDNFCFTLVSRIHGVDIYEERRPYNYMPLKRQFASNIDNIFTISNIAKEYLINKYNYDSSILKVSRLGVDDKGVVSSFSPKNKFHLVSCSSMIYIKRLDKIIESLRILSSLHPKIHFTWTHIGDGVLYNSIKKQAIDKLEKLENIDFLFLGHVINKEVYNFYKNNNIDVFINVSQTEGVPVSIMEAMSCRIPIIAPDIGGISEMVNHNTSGMLMNDVSMINEIVFALGRTDFYKSYSVRMESYNIFTDKFLSVKNYPHFLSEIVGEVKYGKRVKK